MLEVRQEVVVIVGARDDAYKHAQDCDEIEGDLTLADDDLRVFVHNASKPVECLEHEEDQEQEVQAL